MCLVCSQVDRHCESSGSYSFPLHTGFLQDFFHAAIRNRNWGPREFCPGALAGSPSAAMYPRCSTAAKPVPWHSGMHAAASHLLLKTGQSKNINNSGLRSLPSSPLLLAAILPCLELPGPVCGIALYHTLIMPHPVFVFLLKTRFSHLLSLVATQIMG